MQGVEEVLTRTLCGIGGWIAGQDNQPCSASASRRRLRRSSRLKVAASFDNSCRCSSLASSGTSRDKHQIDRPAVQGVKFDQFRPAAGRPHDCPGCPACGRGKATPPASPVLPSVSRSSSARRSAHRRLSRCCASRRAACSRMRFARRRIGDADVTEFEDARGSMTAIVHLIRRLRPFPGGRCRGGS